MCVGVYKWVWWVCECVHGCVHVCVCIGSRTTHKQTASAHRPVGIDEVADQEQQSVFVLAHLASGWRWVIGSVLVEEQIYF